MHEGHRNRLREKLYSHGDSLTDIEVLELILYNCISRKDTNPVAHALLDCFCDLRGVFTATPRLLCAVAGVGPRTAEYIYLQGLLHRRMDGAVPVTERLYNFAEVGRYVDSRFSGEKDEKLEICLTDRDGILLCRKNISEARKDRVVFDSQKLNFILSEVKPCSLIIAHNHPSGVAQPSEDDDAALLEIAQICRMQGVRMSDSVIYASGDLFSYYHSGRLALLLQNRHS